MTTAMVFVIFITECYYIISPVLMEAFQVDRQTAYGIMSLKSTGFAVGMLVFGPLADYYGRRLVFIIGLGCFGLSCLWTGYAASIYVLMVCGFCQGFFGSAVTILSIIMMYDQFDQRSSIRYLSFIGMATSIARMVVPYVSGFFSTHFTWRWVFLSVGAGACVLWVLSLVYLSETLNKHQRSDKAPIMDMVGYCLVLLQNKPFMICCFAAALTGTSYVFLVGNWVYYMKTVNGFTAEKAGFYQSMTMVWGFIGSIVLFFGIQKRQADFFIITSLGVQAVACLVFMGLGLSQHMFFGVIPLMFVAYSMKIAQTSARVRGLHFVSASIGLAVAFEGMIESCLNAIAPLFIGQTEPMNLVLSAGSLLLILLGLMVVYYWTVWGRGQVPLDSPVDEALPDGRSLSSEKLSDLD
jgi:MFS family permease